MYLESIRMLTAAMSSSVYGVNVKIPNVQRDAGDPTPPLMAYIADETTDGSVSRNRLPTTYPFLIVTAEAGAVLSLEPEVHQTTRDGEVHLLVTFGLSNSTTENATRDSYYITRAIQQVIRAFDNDALQQTDRTRNNITLIACKTMESYTPTRDIDDSIVVTDIRLTYMARDTNP